MTSRSTHVNTAVHTPQISLHVFRQPPLDEDGETRKCLELRGHGVQERGSEGVHSCVSAHRERSDTVHERWGTPW